MADYVNVSAWRNLLAQVWSANRNVSGAVAILSLLSQQAGQVVTKRHELAGDYFVTRGLGEFDARFEGLMRRLTWYTDELVRIAHDEAGVRVDELIANIIGPIINGDFPKGFGNADARLRDGLTLQSDGSWSSDGDATLSASSWNQVMEAWATDREIRDSTWVPDAVLDWWSNVEHDLDEKAPGEEKTATDHVRDAMRDAKDAFVDTTKSALAAVGEGALGLLGYAAIGVGVIYGLKVLVLDRKR